MTHEPPSALDPRIERIADLMDAGVILLSGSKEVEFASRRARDLLGLDAGAQAGWDEFVDRLRESVDRAWSDRAEGQAVDLPWPAGESSKTLRFLIHFLDEEECAGFLLVVRDRSLQRALEADLALAAQLRNLSRLYVGLAHDLRSPLNAIVLNLELLKRSLGRDGGGDPLDDRRARWLEILEKETRRLGDSLDVLLAHAVEPAPERSRFDLNDVVRNLARLLGGQALQQEVEIRQRLRTEPLPIVGRRDRLQSALLNVAVNGLEAAPEGGTVELSTRRDGDVAEVTIADDGPGIPESIAERIFELHFTTKTTGGTGIGLYVARSAAQADGGDLELVRSSSAGTVFAARWPLAAADG